jgi:hypothetical protein
VLALEVGLSERNTDVSVLVVVYHALVSGDEGDKTEEERREDLLEVHLVILRKCGDDRKMYGYKEGSC